MIRTSSLKILLTLGLVFIIAACESGGKKQSPSALKPFKPEVKLGYLWSRKVDELGRYYQQFEMMDDAQYLYVAAATGVVYQLDKDNGATGWRTDVDEQLTAGASVDREHVYVGTRNGFLIALDKRDGKEVWRAQLSSEPVSPPGSDNGDVVIHTNDGAVFNFDAKTGEQKWKYNAVMPTLTIRGTSQPQFFAQFVAVGLASGKMAILDRTTGQLRWENKVGIPEGDTEIERIVDVDARPLVTRDKLFAVSYQGRVVAYDLQNGRTLWAEDESSYRDMAMGYGNLYVSGSNGSIVAYDQMSGNIKWAQEDLLYRPLTAPVIASGYIAIADFEGYLHILSQVDGHFVARKRIDFAPLGLFHRDRQKNVRRMMKANSGVRAPVLADGERIYTLANDGSLRAFEIVELN